MNVSITDLTATVTYLYSFDTPVVHKPSRPKGWRVFDYDGCRPCLPLAAMWALAERLAKKKGAE